MTVPKDDKFFPEIVKHWPILVFFAGMFITWGVFSNRISSAEAEISTIKSTQDKTTETVITVRENLVEIKTSLEFIKDKLDTK